jgi:hypothetical protein
MTAARQRFEAKAIGCFAGCARARMSIDPYDVHISPDGRHACVDGLFTVAAFAVHD